MMTSLRIRIVIAVALLVALPTIVAACPMCSDGLFSPGDAQGTVRVAKAFVVSIGTLLAVPALMVTGLAVWMVRSARRARR